MFYRVLCITGFFILYVWFVNLYAESTFKTQKKINFARKEPQHNNKPSPQPAFNFSACLLIKDDNQILPEWIAYHYTVLPLRHLIVAVDPFSLTSPKPILDEFSRLGMDIEVWRDKVSIASWYHSL
jgi:hypothetical protein